MFEVIPYLLRSWKGKHGIIPCLTSLVCKGSFYKDYNTWYKKDKLSLLLLLALILVTFITEFNIQGRSSAKMIQLLFALLAIELVFTLILSFANPLRKLMVKGLDLIKQGRGPLVINTVAATVILVLGSTIYTIIKINQRSKDAGTITPTDEVLMAHHLLEASLMGFSLLLGLVIDRQHYYIREITLLRKNLEIAKKQNHNREPPKIREETEKKKDK